MKRPLDAPIETYSGDLYREAMVSAETSLVKLRPLFVIAFAAVFLLILIIQPAILASAAASQFVNVSNTNGNSFNPKIAATTSGSDGKIYVVWVDTNVATGENEVLFARSNDTGATFSTPVTLGSTLGNPDSALPQLAVSERTDGNDDVFVVWIDRAFKVFVANSTDSGTSFSSPVPVSNGDGLDPQIALVPSTGGIPLLLVTWQESDDIFLATSTDGGHNFENVNVSNDPDQSSKPKIAATTSGSDGKIYVVWVDTNVATGENEVLFARSNDTGATFSTPVTLGSTLQNSVPQVIAGSSNDSVYAAWVSATSGTNRLLFINSTNNGDSFSSTLQISDDAGFVVNPQMLGTNNGIYLVWQDNFGLPAGQFGLFYSRSLDGGKNFDAPVNLGNIVDRTVPDIVVMTASGNSADALFTVWENNNVPSQKNQIFTSSSTNGGQTFGCPFNLGQTEGMSTTPAISAKHGSSGNNLYAMWSDDYLGSTDILFQKADYLMKSIAINSVNNTSPIWGVDAVSISGNVINIENSDASSRKVTIDWGDGSTPSSHVSIEDCSWGPVSHVYTSPPSATSGNATRVIQAKLVNGDTVEATSQSTSITLQRHLTDILLKPIASVKQGTNITLSGSLRDISGGPLLENYEVLLDGPGTGELAAAGGKTVRTASDGSFSTSIKTLNVVADQWAVVGHFAGSADYYEFIESAPASYDTASSSAAEYPVETLGENIPLDLAEFDSSMKFDQVSEPGKLFVSSCNAPVSERYLALDGKCLNISPGLIPLPNTSTRITMSYDTSPAPLPLGYRDENVDIFAVDILSDGTINIKDITESRDVASKTVTGNTMAFSNFIVGIALHPDPPLDSAFVNPQVYVGNNEVYFRNVDNRDNSSAVITLDDTPFASGQTKTLTIVDAGADLDPNAKDRVTAKLSSNTSSPAQITIGLTETNNNSAIFVGTFIVSSSIPTSGNTLQANAGDKIFVSYEQKSINEGKSVGGRFKAVIEGTKESGLAQLRDGVVDFDDTINNWGRVLVTNPVDLTFVDSQLSDAGTISVTMSYANAVLGADPDVFKPELLYLFHKDRDFGWEDLTTPLDVDAHNSTAMTVTSAQKTVTGGIFVLGFKPGAGGGSGGGLARPGAGIVVDFIASLKPLSEKPSDSATSGSGNKGGSGRAVFLQQTYAGEYFLVNPLARFSTEPVAILNAGGGSSPGQVHSGDQVRIESTIANHQSGVTQHYAWIVKITDKNGVTTAIDLQEGSLDPGRSAAVSILWTAKVEPGVYTIRIFTWDGVGPSPSPLADVNTNSLKVQGS